ncbi:MAG: Hsp20/alpha crystallin family protein [Lentisphaerae bacterium]|nr:Hsp20/alpha crystallin family protein [Lentisphaerota bacterium]
MNAMVKHSRNDLGKELLWNPWKDFMNMDRFWDKFENLQKLDSVFCPRIGLKEDKNYFTVTTQLPGIPKEDIKIEYDLGVLTISAERKAEKTKEGEKYHRNEHEYGYFYNRITLPGKVDGTKIHAEYRNGMLKVELPKSEEKTAMEIKVK